MWFITNPLFYLMLVIIIRVMVVCTKKLVSFLFNLKIKSKLDSIKIWEIKDELQCEVACNYIKMHCQDLSALGFDCEWVTKNGKQRPVALLQLATVHGLCCLFRLNILQTIPIALEDILQDPNIIKLGISPLNDSRLLQRDYNVQVRSTLDLRHLYSTDGGLASLSASEIGVTLNKDWRVICSNWESPTLTEAQTDYAAKDAYVAVEIFKKWLLTNNEMLYLFFLEINYSSLLNKEFSSNLFRYLDVHFKPKNSPDTSAKPQNSRIILEGNTISPQKQRKNGYVTRKSPLYHNCFMHAPDGELLCSCDRRKAQWYLDRDLAEILPGEPFSIRLLFEPAARAGKKNEGRFYQQLKQNRCVVCGALDSYLKHNVVPKEYRKHFPNIMKDHQSHDIVLMCLRCHHLAAQHNENLRQKLALLCDAPITTSKVAQVRTIQKVKNSGKALLYKGDNIPTERRTSLENEIKKYYEVDTVTKDLLEKAANLESKTIVENYESHGIKIVNYFLKQGGGLTKLEVLWREHFLTTMKPKYLPALWSVTHNHSRLSADGDEK